MTTTKAVADDIEMVVGRALEHNTAPGSIVLYPRQFASSLYFPGPSGMCDSAFAFRLSGVKPWLMTVVAETDLRPHLSPQSGKRPSGGASCHLESGKTYRRLPPSSTCSSNHHHLRQHCSAGHLQQHFRSACLASLPPVY
jgi:hypothetical protein